MPDPTRAALTQLADAVTALIAALNAWPPFALPKSPGLVSAGRQVGDALEQARRAPQTVTQADVRDFIVQRFGPDELLPESGIGDAKLTEEHEELTAAIDAWRAGTGTVEAIGKEAGDMLICLFAMGEILGFDLMACARAKHERNMAATGWEKLPDGRWKRTAPGDSTPAHAREQPATGAVTQNTPVQPEGRCASSGRSHDPVAWQVWSGTIRDGHGAAAAWLREKREG